MTSRGMQNRQSFSVLQLVYISIVIFRIFGLFPYKYSPHDLMPGLSWLWRIYSAFCIAFYILAFGGYCVYALYRHTEETSEDTLMDFVRISEVVIITVNLMAIIITEQCFYRACAAMQVKLNGALRDAFDDFSGNNRHRNSLQRWFYGEVVGTSWRFAIRTVLLTVVCASIGYSKCIRVLEFLPMGWNYLAMALILIPFVALSLVSSKFCAYIYAFDHGFQMLNKHIQLIVQKLNSHEMKVMLQRQRLHRDSSDKGINGVVHSPAAHSNVQRNINLIEDSGSSRPLLRSLLYGKQELMFELQQLIFCIRSKHDALCQLVEDFFKLWALYMLLFLTMYFCLFVIEAFFLFTNVYKSVKSGNGVDQEYAWLNLRACLMVVIELTWTIGACSSLMDSIQGIGVTLNSLVLLETDTGLAQSIESWTIKLLCQRNSVQVFRLFDINNRLLFSVSALIKLGWIRVRQGNQRWWFRGQR